MYIDDIKDDIVCKKWKIIGDCNTNKNIQPEFKNWIWHRKMCHAYDKKWEKTETKEMEMPNQEKIRILVGKENSKYMGILEADTIKLVEMKEKMKKSISNE